MSSWWNRDGVHVLAIAPAAILLSLFFIVPAVWAIYTSMTDLALLSASARNPQFVGMENYRRLWNDPDLPKYLRNTAVFVVGAAVIGQTVGGLLLALLFQHATRLKLRLTGPGFIALMAAWVSPPLLSGFIWGRLLDVRDGVINAALGGLGFGTVDFLGDHAMMSVIAVESWRGIAFATLVLLGALQTVPSDIYEAAQLDGASAFVRLRDHTLPLLRPGLAVVLLMTTINVSGSFLMILVLTNGDPGRQTETIALFAFHRAFQFFEIAFGSAITVVILGFNLACALVYLLLLRRQR
jgi:multiple sugar transport system permease protein